MSLRDAARANWRANLHEFGSAGLRAGGLDAMADANDARVARNRAYAALMVELHEAKTAYTADPNTGTKAVLDDVKQRVVAHRVDERTNHPQILSVNNFLEPSDAELAEMGY